MEPPVPVTIITPTAAAIATPPAPTTPAVPDVRNLPEKRKYWGTNPPRGFPVLDDKIWHYNKDYYPPSKDAAAAIESQYRAFLMWCESLARPGNGGVYRHQDSDGDYAITARSLISRYGIQFFLNVIALAQLDLQGRCWDVEYEQRMGWYAAGIHVGMREDDLNQSLHNLATTFGLKRQELRFKAASTGNGAFIGSLKFYRSDGFPIEGGYECSVEIPDIDDVRATHFLQDAPLITVLEHLASLSAALAEGLSQVLYEKYGDHLMVTPGGRGSMRFKRLMSTLEKLCPKARFLHFGDSDGYGLSIGAELKSGSVASNYQNRDLIMEKLESVHVPLRTLIADGCRLKLATRKDDKEITRLEEISRMNQDMEENAGDMRETGMAASLATHLGHFVEDLCPLIEQCLSIPPPSTDGVSLSTSDLPDNPIAPFDYLVSDAGLAQLELKEVPHPEDSCFEIDYNGVRARVEILDSSSTVLLTLLDHDEECTMDFAEPPSLMGEALKIQELGISTKRTTKWSQIDRVKCMVKITREMTMNSPDMIIVNCTRSVQQYHELLTIATSPLLSEDLELDRVTGAILYMELIWEEICSMVMGERPFACKKERCTSRFKTQHELTRHAGTHSG